MRAIAQSNQHKIRRKTMYNFSPTAQKPKNSKNARERAKHDWKLRKIEENEQLKWISIVQKVKIRAVHLPFCDYAIAIILASG